MYGRLGSFYPRQLWLFRQRPGRSLDRKRSIAMMTRPAGGSGWAWISGGQAAIAKIATKAQRGVGATVEGGREAATAVAATAAKIVSKTIVRSRRGAGGGAGGWMGGKKAITTVPAKFCGGQWIDRDDRAAGGRAGGWRVVDWNTAIATIATSAMNARAFGLQHSRRSTWRMGRGGNATRLASRWRAFDRFC